MSDSPSPAAKPPADPDAAKRLRERVDQLLARAPVVSSGAVALQGGAHLDYSVRAAFVPVLAGGVGADRGEPQAAVFTVAYTANLAPTAAPRPVCFAFNGGPGSASI